MVKSGGCAYSISCTTRPPRGGEINGKDYHFLSVKEFENKVENDDFLEHAEVHGHLYGTLKSSVEEQLRAGIDILIDIDVQGAALIRNCEDEAIQVALTDLFILPPSTTELESRLRGRGTEDEGQLALRMQNAIAEMKHWPAYIYTLISGTPDEDLAKFSVIIQAERLRSSRRCRPGHSSKAPQ